MALFLWRGGHWLVVEAPLQQADAIVMLLGSTPERELEVADIYHQGFAPIIIMAEFRVYNHELIEAHGLTAPRGLDNSLSILNQLDIPPEAIHITPGDISSTRGEAIAIATFLQQNPHIKSIILVSSPSHMRRATLVFRREFRRGGIDCVIIPRPTSYGNFKPNGWYCDRESAKSVLYEYIKIAGWVAGIK
jgi:uncharacterized SAM-binding protein YcdF (DUF218 family)